MHSPEAQGFARFGGALLAISLVLPYFAISFAGFAGISFRLWTVDKGAFVLVAAFALMALAQVRFSTRSTTALIYLIVGGIFTAVIIYKVWISPPGSAPIGDIGGTSGGTMTVNGKSGSAGSFSTRDILEAMGIEMKASYGAFVAMLGSAFFTVGAFLDWRGSGDAPAPAQRMDPVAQGQYQPQRQFQPQAQYQAPAHEQPGFQSPPTPAATAPPDPFAPPAQPQSLPQDPFAPPPDPFAPKPSETAAPGHGGLAAPGPHEPSPAAPSPPVPSPPAPGPPAPSPAAPSPPVPGPPAPSPAAPSPHAPGPPAPSPAAPSPHAPSPPAPSPAAPSPHAPSPPAPPAPGAQSAPAAPRPAAPPPPRPPGS